jgi:hypothetical protein
VTNNDKVLGGSSWLQIAATHIKILVTLRCWVTFQRCGIDSLKLRMLRCLFGKEAGARKIREFAR